MEAKADAVAFSFAADDTTPPADGEFPHAADNATVDRAIATPAAARFVL
ncbi:MAG: hypothetical protein LH630_00065 [Actinomycetia bacterium]|nr:hypothetical protein [Actinomycetes bacterium]